MKKNRLCYRLSREHVKKKWMIMRLCFLLICGFTFSLSANSLAQQERVTLNLKNVTVKVLLDEIQRQTKLCFIFNPLQTDQLGKLSLQVKNETVEEVLRRVLKDTDLTFKFRDELIIITRKGEKDDEKKEKTIVAQGIVKDTKGIPLPGVTVMIKGTSLGVVTDVKGAFKIALPQDTVTLVFTFVGMKTQSVKLKAGEERKDLNIVMKDDEQKIDEVVVTGYMNIKKSSFTGSATHVKKEDIMKVGASNVIDILQVFDPSLRVMRNNDMGSDPNTLPEFYVRGRSGISNVRELDALEAEDVSKYALTNNPNTPIFILDDFEVSVQKIYDMDLNRIKDITILKDAAATAMYGSRASNGVIVIETVAPKPGELTVNYNGNLEITAPDLSSYNLMNAKDKLAAEVAAGLFEPENAISYESSWDSWWRSAYSAYIKKLNYVLQGKDTYWLSQPLQTQFNHKHSVYVEGGAENIRFGVELRYDNQNGVMKESYRDRIGAGLTLDYRWKGLQVKNQVNYNVMKNENSPYGSFSDYSRKQPYAYWLNDDGSWVELISNGATSVKNPLYEAKQGNFSKNGYKEWTNNLSVNWFFNEHWMVKAQVAVTLNDAWTENFTSPTSGTYTERGQLFSKGELIKTETKTNSWDGNAFLSYNRSIGIHNINFSAGTNIKSTSTKYIYSHYRGFPDADHHSEAYAYEIVKKPTMSDNETRLLGGFAILNYSLNDIYLFDASYRFDGSSEFGTDRKYAPFWSLGAGLNIHNYQYMQKYGWLNNLKVSASVGETGKSNFQPYVARNTLNAMLDDWYPTGIGASLVAMGNENLTWEKLLTWNFRADIGLFNRVMIKFDYYIKNTKDLVTEVSLPLSSGFSVYTDNIGEVENKGFEVDVNWRMYSTKDWDVSLFGNLAHNKNRLKSISETLKRYNERIDEFYAGYKEIAEGSKMQTIMSTIKKNEPYMKPYMKYEEGNSLTAIYGMKSIGINPADGQEIYVKRDGTLTYDWSSAEQQKVGDSEPWAQGAFGVNLRWRNFTMYTTFLYEWGGDAYNSTLISNVENVDLNAYNADYRVVLDRWQEPGDVSPLKALKDRYNVTRPTSRFVQKNNFVNFNSLSLSYDFNRELIRRVGLSTLKLQFNMKDIDTWSTIKQEMGLSYPFARTFTFTLNASF